MLNRRALALGLVATLLCLPLFAQSQSDKDLLERIRQEEKNNSQIMKTMHMFADVYGPRLTGSPNHKAAAEWAVKQMTAWGLSNAHLEPFKFGRGWSLNGETAPRCSRGRRLPRSHQSRPGCMTTSQRRPRRTLTRSWSLRGEAELR